VTVGNGFLPKKRKNLLIFVRRSLETAIQPVPEHTYLIDVPDVFNLTNQNEKGTPYKQVYW
jgi:hypothetical protein